MPDPGPSPLQSGLPAAAARFGAHILAAAAGSAADPSLPSVPAASRGLPGPPSPLLPGAAGEPAPGAVEALPVEPGLARVLRGPSGLGTTGLYPGRRVRTHPSAHVPDTPPGGVPVPRPAAPSVASAAFRPGESRTATGAPTPESPPEGIPIPGLYHHPVPEPDPERVAEVSRRIKDWAVDEVELYPEEWEGQFDGFSVGRYMVACHPDAPTLDHLMIATRLMVAENAVDDCYCEDHGGSPVGLGGRLLLAHTALDALHTTEEYQPEWERSLHADAPRRAYRSAMDYFVRQSTPSQADRYRHDMARLHLGYLAEAAWAETDHLPDVWEYLAMRQFNNFRPCPTITDTVGGYELPADLHAQAAMQRVLALAGNASTIVNDLYSYTKELAAPGRHLNLPVVIAAREGISDRDAYLKAVDVHNDLMRDFEAAAASLAASCPVPSVLRFLRGVAVWIDGNHYWHQTNTYRYSLPDFW
ncbi:family 2 encapsulin nanocompartment cargo protein terpene cyclase [Streptomyces sp. NBC_01216]|uniref:family 2 encapsulin nanocompartment cargo protein terpene cyclase n=1 Tax=Streptomyces sp. NBC_01216 TaxID=2903778 RepID=UPI002E11C9C5|nr:family 2 encapsulin nanocompartment cargo protein terpene cyclase [Streptomyces sp. NBC_01216]